MNIQQNIIKMEKRDCGFQYTKTIGKIFADIKIVCDESGLTLQEAKELWNKYYPDLRNHIRNGETGEMAIWINMEDEYSYSEKLHHIGNDAELDGDYIIERTTKYFPQTL